LHISNFVNIKENCVIAILDGLGRIIEKQPKGVLRNDFKIENLANGIYYIAVLENGNTLSTKRFIKQP
jgi:hypothetical protein